MAQNLGFSINFLTEIFFETKKKHFSSEIAPKCQSKIQIAKKLPILKLWEGENTQKSN